MCEWGERRDELQVEWSKPKETDTCICLSPMIPHTYLLCDTGSKEVAGPPWADGPACDLLRIRPNQVWKDENNKVLVLAEEAQVMVHSPQNAPS